MLVPKQEILSVIADRGAQDKLAQAENDLPDPVDTDLHAKLLTDLGLSPQNFGEGVELGGIVDEEPGRDADGLAGS